MSRPCCSTPIVFIALLMTAVGCDSQDPVARGTGGVGGDPNMGGSGAGTGGASGGSGGATAGSGGSYPGLIGNGPTAAERDKYCSGRGPAVQIPGPGGSSECAGRLAERTFRFGVCVCEGVAAQRLVTDSLDSRGATMPVAAAAAVGINRSYSLGEKGDIGGSFYMAADFTSSAPHIVHGDAKIHGRLTTSAAMTVTRDLWVGGQVMAAPGTIAVGRDFYNPTGSPAVTARGKVNRQAVTIPPPCDCDPARLVPVDGIVAEGKTNNHNALVGLDPNRLQAVGADLTLPLPCGRFYFSEIRTSGKLTLKITGRTAVYVGGNIAGAGGFVVDVGPEGELDLFVGGSLALSGSLRFGSIERPAASRIYLGTNQGIALSGDGVFVGNLYAPRAGLSTSQNPLVIYGSLFTKDIRAINLEVHYDRAINEAGRDCPAPMPPGTGGSGGAGGAGGAGGSPGMCRLKGGTCASDMDCCAPFACQGGQCSQIFE